MNMCDVTLWQHACTQPASQAGVAAPRLAFANLHVLRSEKKLLLAISLALTERTRRRTRSFKAVFFIGLRPSLRSLVQLLFGEKYTERLGDTKMKQVCNDI